MVSSEEAFKFRVLTEEKGIFHMIHDTRDHPMVA